MCARSVLEPLVGERVKVQKCPDLLQLCHDVPLEVINLRAGIIILQPYSANLTHCPCMYTQHSHKMTILHLCIG